MKNPLWRRWLRTVFGARTTCQASGGGPQRRFLNLEALEDRSVPSGTPAIIADINPGAPSSNPSWMVAIGSTTYFLADDGVHGGELWKSDGTAAGTVMVKEINYPYSWEAPSSLVNVNGTLFFTANDGVHGRELWKSDGTTAGTVMVKDIRPGGEGSVGNFPNFLSVNGTLFFVGNDGVHGGELWKSDGTAAGTVMVKDINPGPASNYNIKVTAVNGTLFFVADDGVHGFELWKSDGTGSGTVMVKDITSGGSTFPSWAIPLTNVNGTLFFTTVIAGTGEALWKSDGTAAGTVIVKDSLNNQGNFTDVNGTLFFTTGLALWKSDGTAAGTVMVKDINPGNAGYPPANLTNVNGTLFFTAADGVHGDELWQSDGTTAGTTLVKDIYPGGSWRYYGGYYQYPNGYIPPSSTYVLNSSDVGNLTNVNGTLFFTAIDGVHGDELWQSDGTTTGTVMVADINPGGVPSFPRDLTNVSGTLFFSADDGIHGTEPWILPPGPPAPPSLSITDVSRVEGNVGATTALFTVQLSAASSETISVQYSTADGTATAGSDYQATSGVLTFAPGERTKTISVLINGDQLVEANETFVINLAEATNAVIFDGRGTGTIVDDEPRISISDVSRSEGNTGQTAFTFTVSLSAATDVAVTVDFTTANGAATAGSDYQATAGTLTIPAGQTIGTITVLVNGDRLAEPNETFLVNLSGAANATFADSQGTGTILDDEPRISISDVTKKEGKKNQTTLFTFTVTLSAAYDQAVTMSYRTVDGTAKTSDSDYVAKTGTLTFAPGETTKTITIEVKGDSKKEANETFYLDLFGNSSNSLFTKNRGIGTILNDD